MTPRLRKIDEDCPLSQPHTIPPTNHQITTTGSSLPSLSLSLPAGFPLPLLTCPHPFYFPLPRSPLPTSIHTPISPSLHPPTPPLSSAILFFINVPYQVFSSRPNISKEVLNKSGYCEIETLRLKLPLCPTPKMSEKGETVSQEDTDFILAGSDPPELSPRAGGR